MKKNLVTVITLALVLVNLVLTVVLTISIVPETTKANELITQGRVFINSEEKTSNSYRCPSDSVFSIRGHGKYRLTFDEGDITKKGKQKITIYQYR